MNIPITFDHQDKTYSGHFSNVGGGGSAAHFHLYIGGYYHGQILFTEHNTWQFSSNTHDEWRELSEDFGRVIVAAYE